VIEIPIRDDDCIVRPDATTIRSAGVVHVAPFVETVRATIRHGNTH
jgi:hypothetical protein